MKWYACALATKSGLLLLNKAWWNCEGNKWMVITLSS